MKHPLLAYGATKIVAVLHDLGDPDVTPSILYQRWARGFYGRAMRKRGNTLELNVRLYCEEFALDFPAASGTAPNTTV